MSFPLPVFPSETRSDDSCAATEVAAVDRAVLTAIAKAAAAGCGGAAFVTTLQDGEERIAGHGGLENAPETIRELATFVATARRPGTPQTIGDFRLVARLSIDAANGRRLGRLGILDRRPRALDGATMHLLQNLAETAAHVIESRLAADRVVAEARARVAWVQTATPAMLHSIDPHGSVLTVSDTWLREMGYAAHEVIGRPIFDFYTPDSRVKSRDVVIPRLFETGRCDDVEYRMIRKDGGVLVVLLSAVVEYASDGTPLRTTSITENITLRRAAEIELRAEQDRMARILEGTDAGTWELDIRTGATRHNARWAEIAGYTLAELGKTTGATWRELMHEEDLPKAVALCVAHYEGKVDYYEMECRIRHRNGSWLWILDRGRVSARDEHGAPLLMHGTRTDITSRKQAEQALRASQDFLERVGQVAGVGGWELINRTGRLTWSDETRRIFAVPPDYEPTVENALAFFGADARERLEQAVRRAFITGTKFDLELPFIAATGHALWTRATASIEFENGKPARLVGAFQDVTRQKRLEAELAESRELLQVTLESIGDAVITTDNDGVVQWLNPVAERMTGWPRQDAVGRPIDDVFVVVDDLTRARRSDPVAACLRKAEPVGVAGHTTLVSRDGGQFGIEDSTSPILRADGTAHGAVLVFHDVSEQRRLSREMNHRATHDPLTGLLNRSEFEARLTRLLSNVQQQETDHALLYIDLDQFKVVNDACGHGAGDQLLRQVSAMLGRCVRHGDSLARLGGDEFGAILERCDVMSAQRVAQNICDEMNAFRFAHDGRRFRVGTSIGLVPVDQRWTSIKALLQAADAACYAAKDGGRNRVHLWFDSDQMLQARQGDMRWASRLESALDEGRFELYGQRIEPIAGSPIGLHCEVLLRLREPDGTIVLPAAFLPAAERFHLATRIDRWVVHQAFEALEDLRSERAAVEMVAINLSGQSLGDRDFHRDVLQLVRDAAFDVRRLCFEITETAAITHLADARSFIEELRALGAKIALDDFGAGASSFGYLKQLPVDFLKIDGHFVRHLLDDELNFAAVRCFCDVARIVGVKTIAEFVERDEIRETLQDIGVDMAQGYLIHRPEPLPRLLAGAVELRAATA